MDSPRVELRPDHANLARISDARERAAFKRAQNAATFAALVRRLTPGVDLESIARQISAERKRRDLTQPEAATELGVSLRAFQDWEAGKTEARSYNRRRLREEWGIVFPDGSEEEAGLIEKLDYLIERVDELVELIGPVVVGRTGGAAAPAPGEESAERAGAKQPMASRARRARRSR